VSAERVQAIKDSYRFSEERQRLARDYLHLGLAVTLTKVSALLFLLLLALGLGAHASLGKFVRMVSSEEWLVIGLYALVGFVLFSLASLPFDYYKEYEIEKRFGLSSKTRLSWLKDKLISSCLFLIFAFIFVEGTYYSMRASTVFWWVPVWIGFSVVALLFSYVAPVLIMPLFYKFPELKDEALMKRLVALAKKAGISVVGIYEMKAREKTLKAIGALSGMANTRRIILSDTLLANFSSDEVEGVIGHELGHHVFHHAGKGLALFIAFFFVTLVIADQVLRATIGFFGLDNMSTIASLPLLALLLALCFAVFTPFMNTFSRWMEGQADQYELDLVNKPDAYISSMTKLCDQNLRYAYPNSLVEVMFYDHPSGKKRLERAFRFKPTNQPTQTLYPTL